VIVTSVPTKLTAALADAEPTTTKAEIPTSIERIFTPSYLVEYFVSTAESSCYKVDQRVKQKKPTPQKVSATIELQYWFHTKERNRLDTVEYLQPLSCNIGFIGFQDGTNGSAG
jgi:hypothetical protein